MENDGVAIEPRAVDIGRGTAWLGEAFGLFRRAPAVWIGIVVIWFVISLMLNLLPVAGLVSVFLNPVFQAGLMLGCASLVAGSGLRVGHLFAGFSSGRIGPLLLLGVFTLLLGFALVLVSLAVVVGLIGGTTMLESPDRIGGLSALLTVLIVVALTVPLIMAVWFAPALIVLRNVPAWEAMKLSFRGCLLNIGPFLVYGVVALVMLIVASIPLFLGLLVAMPVLIASVYIGYRDIFPG